MITLANINASASLHHSATRTTSPHADTRWWYTGTWITKVQTTFKVGNEIIIHSFCLLFICYHTSIPTPQSIHHAQCCKIRNETRRISFLEFRHCTWPPLYSFLMPAPSNRHGAGISHRRHQCPCAYSPAQPNAPRSLATGTFDEVEYKVICIRHQA
jgi:hypothetical protein